MATARRESEGGEEMLARTESAEQADWRGSWEVIREDIIDAQEEEKEEGEKRRANGEEEEEEKNLDRFDADD